MTVVLAFMTATGPVTMDIYLASMPHIAKAFDTSIGAVQLTLSLYVVGFAIGQIIYGPVSDTYGRRPMLLIGFALYLLATSACALATSIEALVVARIVQALGAAGPIILARAIVRDLYEGTQAAKQLGTMSTIAGVTPIGAPVLGGFLQAWFGWESGFVVMTFIGFVLALCGFLFLPETNKRRLSQSLSVRGIVASFAIVARNKAYCSYLALLVLAYAGIFGFFSGSSHVLQSVFGFTSVGYGLIHALCSISFIVGTSSGPRLVSKFGLDGMIGLGVNFLLAGGLLQLLGYWAFPDQWLGIVVPQMMYFLGTGLMLPQAIAAALTPFPDRAGAASSLMGCAQMTFAAIVGAIEGASLGETAWPLVVVMCLAGTAAFAVFRATASVRTAGITEP